MIPLRDASRTPVRFPVVTVSLIAVNVLAFLWEVGSDEAAIIRWAVVPTELMRGQLFRHSALTTRHRDAHRTPAFISSPGLDPASAISYTNALTPKQIRYQRVVTGEAFILRCARWRLGTVRLLRRPHSADRFSEREGVMNKVIFVGFDSEEKAYEGDRALHEMHRDGTLTLYNDAVVVKERDGKVAVRRAPDAESLGTLGGMLTGGLIGVLGGPVGAAVGLGAGTLIGAAFDLTKEGVDLDFVEDAGARLGTGKAAVIAEIDEQWQVPLDIRMEALGGKLVRRTPTQIEDAYLEREIETAQKELAVLESETVAEVKASETEHARKRAEKLQAKIDAATRKVQEKEDELVRKLQSVKDEGEQKIAVLEAQRATATAESKAQLERRLADMRTDYQGRTRRLQEARDRRKAAHATAAA